MKRVFITAFILVGFAIFSVVLYNISLFYPDINPIPVAEETTFNEIIKGCAKDGKNNSLLTGHISDPQIRVSGSLAYYYRALNQQCCRTLKINSEIIGNKINIYENWKGQGCECMCYSELGLMISDLLPANYTLYVYQNATSPLTDSSPELNFLFSQTIQINETFYNGNIISEKD